MPSVSNAIKVCLLTVILGVLLTHSQIGIYLEKTIGLYLLFKLRGVREPPSEVVIVGIDKYSTLNLNLPLELKEWPRSIYAELTNALDKGGASVIIFDLFFKKASSLTEQDDLFAKAMSDAYNVILCEDIIANKPDSEEEDLIKPFDKIKQSAFILAPSPMPAEQRVSFYWKFYQLKTGKSKQKNSEGNNGSDQSNKEFLPTLPVVAFQIHALNVYDEFINLLKKNIPYHVKKLPQNKTEIIETKSVKNLILIIRDFFKKKPSIAESMLKDLENFPIDAYNRKILKSLIRMYMGSDCEFLNFYGPPGTITTVPIDEILSAQNESAASLNQIDFRDKIVFVGVSETLEKQRDFDGHTTPFSKSNRDMSGVEMVATALANILEDNHLQPPQPHPWAWIIIISLYGILLGLICIFFSSGIAFLCITVLNMLYLIFIFYQFKIFGIWHSLIIPLLFQTPGAYFCSILWKYFYTNKERQNIKKAFGYFLPAKVVDHLARDLADIDKNCQIVYGTCLFTDAENYTSFSETQSPKELRNFLNKYFKVIFKPIKDHDGIVSDIKGDSILAIWAIASYDAAIRHHACLAALEILDGICSFNKSSATLQLPIRIGLHSGKILLGTIGAVDHYEYRPVGDIVNTVSRIDGLNKYLGTRILVTKDVLYQLEGFHTREIGKFLLAGKSLPILVFELISRIEDATREKFRLCEIFNKALIAFKKQAWDEATEGFHESSKTYKDGPSTFYLSQCEKYRENPPGKEWDGLIHLLKK